MVSVGMIVWLSSELMFFAGLFGIYFTARATRPSGWPPPPTDLDVPYALVFTIILVASSFTCQFGVFAAERGDVFGLRRWYMLTFVMGRSSCSARPTSTATWSTRAPRSRRRRTARCSS